MAASNDVYPLSFWLGNYKHPADRSNCAILEDAPVKTVNSIFFWLLKTIELSGQTFDFLFSHIDLSVLFCRNAFMSSSSGLNQMNCSSGVSNPGSFACVLSELRRHSVPVSKAWWRNALRLASGLLSQARRTPQGPWQHCTIAAMDLSADRS